MSVGSTKPGAARSPLHSMDAGARRRGLSFPPTHLKRLVCCSCGLKEFCVGKMTTGKRAHVSAAGQWVNAAVLPLNSPQLSQASRRGTAHHNFNKNMGVGSVIGWAGVIPIRSRGTGGCRIRASPKWINQP